MTHERLKNNPLFVVFSLMLLASLGAQIVLPLFLFGKLSRIAFAQDVTDNNQDVQDTGNLEDVKAGLREQLQSIQAEIDAYREKIKQAGQKEQDLTGQINTLQNKIKKLNLEIESLRIAINDVNRRIDVILKTNAQIEKNIGKEKVILSRSLRLVYENDSFNYIEIFFKKDKLSDVFSDVKALEEIQESLLSSLNEIRDLKKRLEDEKVVLDDRQEELSGLKKMQEIQTASLNGNKATQERLLAQTKNQKTQLISQVEVSQATLEEIRNQLYQLEGLGVSLKFGDALKYAQLATVKTHVRAALLLAMLKKESEWGNNVGTGTWRQDMHQRDQDAFLAITQKLGLDPDTTPVSKKPSYGWGGAMGPAQFLPNTWLSYEEEIARLTGHNPPNPWDIGDAFMACAIKLKQANADAQTYDAEWKAAQVYFAGRRWNDPRYYFYGDSVMELAEQFQKQIDILDKG